MIEDPFRPAGQQVSASAIDDVPWPTDSDGFAPHAKRLLAPPAKVQPPKAWRTPAARALSLGYAGERVPFGITTLDVAIRGGLVPGSFVIVIGAPGAGKTTLVVQVARERFADGHAVAILAADESANGLLIRWGQSLGIRREDLERADDDARTVLAEAVDSDRLVLVDAAEERDATVDAVAERLAALAKDTGRPGLLIVDSLQTARSITSEAAESPREKVNAVIDTLRNAARAHGLLILATSEMARSGYRGGGVPNSDPLASGKETGAIEYQCDVLLALTTPKGKPSTIDALVPKSRLGGTGTTFRLEIDHARASVSEVDVPDDEGDGDDDRDAVHAARVEEVGRALLLALARHPSDVVGQRQLRALVRGRDAVKQDAIAWLLAHGRITGGGREPYRAVAARGDDSDEGAA
ncbi:RAD55 family ATPase [Sandaracinus amylolyticus]|uniref:RAD55 family ATPase n=1 Tax=Sandaracinus amylolyticus TaxID=927083 RepID=UPI001F1B5871|nr:AAA family ATPase [Sandaracinus amylolyticus]UJR79861.1 Hypothetical protein I5071_19000 [Sandaracinus amylolyticus]